MPAALRRAVDWCADGECSSKGWQRHREGRGGGGGSARGAGGLGVMPCYLPRRRQCRWLLGVRPCLNIVPTFRNERRNARHPATDRHTTDRHSRSDAPCPPHTHPTHRIRYTAHHSDKVKTRTRPHHRHTPAPVSPPRIHSGTIPSHSPRTPHRVGTASSHIH